MFAVAFLNDADRQAAVQEDVPATLDAKITRARLVGETRALVRAGRLSVPTPSLVDNDKRHHRGVPGRR